MKCPNCKIEDLAAINILGIEVSACKNCHGMWLRKDELKEVSKAALSPAWADINLWEDKKRIGANVSQKVCPICTALLITLVWDEGKFAAELCPSCGGVWLTKAEYQKLLSMIKSEVEEEIASNYVGTLTHQLELLFSGKKNLPEELHELAQLARFFEYKFAAQHPLLTEVIEEMPLTK